MKADRLKQESISTVAGGVSHLEFTGERIVPGRTAEALFRQHEERYVFASQYVFGKDVLDVACGTGVGTSFLRGAGARRVCGMDIDPDAIAFARARYGKCEFMQSDATDMCFADSSVDVVVSFETLEHLRDQKEFLMECRRVLRPGGVLICSTPNQSLSRWGGPNPYHSRELTVTEFTHLLTSIFGKVQLYAQECRVYPLYVAKKVLLSVLDTLQLAGPIKRFLRPKPVNANRRTEFVGNPNGVNGNIRPHHSARLTEPTFVIAVASNPQR
jgi:2-polyprenyl-3-methyl-5-hydroxy-6-metoxy-1,4-benzoquinol methylase